MRSLVHQETLGAAVALASLVYFYHSKPIELDLQAIMRTNPKIKNVYQNETALVNQIMQDLHPGDQLIFMSNGALASIEQKLKLALSQAGQIAMATD
jgi:UDP-N-acetylmuramate-alanine ligase